MKTDRGIFYKTVGSDLNPPLLLVMGYSGNRESWNQRFIDELALDHHLILMDNRGTGESDFPASAAACSVEEMSADILSVVRALNDDSVFLLGYSLGGVAALQFAYEQPGRVRGLILLSSTMGQPYYTAPTDEVWEQISSPPGLNVLEKTESIWRACLPLATFDSYKQELAEIFARSSRYPISRRVMAWQLAAYRGYTFPCGANSWRPPFRFLVIHGANDRLTPAINSAEIAQQISGTELHLIANCEHMPHLEARDSLTALIRSLTHPVAAAIT